MVDEARSVGILGLLELQHIGSDPGTIFGRRTPDMAQDEADKEQSSRLDCVHLDIWAGLQHVVHGANLGHHRNQRMFRVLILAESSTAASSRRPDDLYPVLFPAGPSRTFLHQDDYRTPETRDPGGARRIIN